MKEKCILKEKTFEGLYLFLRQLAASVDDSVKLIETAYSNNILGSYSSEKIEECRRQKWDEIRRERIEEHGRRGQTLYFDVEGADVKRLGEKIKPGGTLRGSKPIVWSMTTPIGEKPPKSLELLGSPRTDFRNRAQADDTEYTIPVRHTRSEPATIGMPHPPIRGKRGRGRPPQRGNRGTKTVYRGVPANQTRVLRTTPRGGSLRGRPKIPGVPAPRRKHSSDEGPGRPIRVVREDTPKSNPISSPHVDKNRNPRQRAHPNPNSPLVKQHKKAPPPLPPKHNQAQQQGNQKPTRAPRQIIDSRYEERFRPLSVFFDTNTSSALDSTWDPNQLQGCTGSIPHCLTSKNGNQGSPVRYRVPVNTKPASRTKILDHVVIDDEPEPEEPPQNSNSDSLEHVFIDHDKTANPSSNRNSVMRSASANIYDHVVVDD